MPDEQLQEQLLDTARRLAADSRTGDVDGEDVARELGCDPNDAALYDAFRVAEHRGELECQAWRGGMGLPAMVRV